LAHRLTQIDLLVLINGKRAFLSFRQILFLHLKSQVLLKGTKASATNCLKRGLEGATNEDATVGTEQAYLPMNWGIAGFAHPIMPKRTYGLLKQLRHIDYHGSSQSFVIIEIRSHPVKYLLQTTT
jgi:hypothetical protein